LIENFNPQIILESPLVMLRPLRESDFDDLYAVASDPAIWEQHPAKERSNREGFTKFFHEAMQSGSAFLIIDRKSGKPIGSSRYNFNRQVANAIEIGWTFLAKQFWGGEYNGSIKSLMIGHALKHFDYVLFYVDKNNFRSQRAVEKIGGKRISELEGIVLEIKPAASVIFCISKSDRGRS
jgi:N-acetyltransferase